ncbi:putative acetate kinase [Escovopsis weberi]|uniref:Probable acetate kinase n=1 Tax=Escovopsis weberi TaxID=150374 RepID=A0A0M8N6C1_ESCWE|nr:putative acetate kinase [Escovopsis weberi]
MKVILSINSGSSSVKVSVYSAVKGAAPRQIAECQVSGLTAPPAQLRYSRAGQTDTDKRTLANTAMSQNEAFALILQTLIDDADLREVRSKESIAIACHRVVHGGDFSESKVLTKDTYHYLEKLSDLAPLHNGPALVIVDSCLEQLPGAINVACFDSQFHATMPSHIFTYPIDQEIAKKNQLRKYGFHGISYAFIARSVAEHLGRDLEQLNIIALHLGSGASVSGLPGATRSGNVDPSSMDFTDNYCARPSDLVFHYTSNAGKLSPASTGQLHISRAEEILNKHAGWKSLTGTTNFGSISDNLEDDPRCRLAFDLFVDRICGFLGSYFVSLGGKVDALVFAGGIGENSAKLRNAVVQQAGCLGFAIDEAANAAAAATGGDIVRDVGPRDAKPRVLVCQTDEQFEMARTCTQMETLWN